MPALKGAALAGHTFSSQSSIALGLQLDKENSATAKNSPKPTINNAVFIPQASECSDS